MDDDEAASYDEFSMLKIYADHEGIPWNGQPTVERREVISHGYAVSMLVWGFGDPEFVLLHSSGQNAHTWDSVALALGRPLVAIDLPGHGRSAWRSDRRYHPWDHAQILAPLIAEVAPNTSAVVGFAAGGLAGIRLCTIRPDLVRRAVLIDSTPGVVARASQLSTRERGTTVLISGPRVFESFDAMLRAVAATAPDRPIETLRPGVLHNAKRNPNGTWSWRYDDLHRTIDQRPDYRRLWDDVSAAIAPLMLVRGEESAYVHDDDVSEFLVRSRDARAETIPGATHAVQSDRPRQLAALISHFVATTEPSSAARSARP